MATDPPVLPGAVDAEPPLWTTTRVARKLGIEVETVRAYARDGKIRASKVGRSYRFRPEWVDAFIDASGPRRAKPQPRATAEPLGDTI